MSGQRRASEARPDSATLVPEDEALFGGGSSDSVRVELCVNNKGVNNGETKVTIYLTQEESQLCSLHE